MSIERINKIATITKKHLDAYREVIKIPITGIFLGFAILRKLECEINMIKLEEPIKEGELIVPKQSFDKVINKGRINE